MTKEALQQDLQAELKEKVKEGVKPSHLKRSKSADDVSSVPPAPPPLILSSDELRNESKLRIALDQVKEKQKEVECLRKQKDDLAQQIKELKTQLAQTQQDLDNSLTQRLQALKDFDQLKQQKKQLAQELDLNVEEASEELINQDETISNLRTELSTLKKQNQSLTRDLNLAQRIIRLPHLGNSPDSYPFLKYALYSLLIAGFTLWLVNSFRNTN
jgi:uncharacterized membrane protein YccC